ncbi:hypothetical protein HDU91_006782, partial [Kappamyces sp. JEL0680]
TLGLPFALTDQARFVEKARLFPPHITLHWILGYDTVVRFFNRSYYQDFETEMAQFFQSARNRLVVFDRANSTIQTPPWDREEMKCGRQWQEFIQFMPMLEGRPVSSTLVRSLMLQHYANPHDTDIVHELHALVPPQVLRIMIEQGLYQA